MRKIYLSLFAAALLFAGCEKDEPKDEQAPELSISGLHESGLLVGEETVQITATDAGGIEKIDAYLGREYLNSLQEAPYELMINTSDFEDGDYELRIVAYDRAGNTQEWKQQLRVSNTLMEIDLSKTLSAWAEDERDRHIVISDKEGNLLESIHVEGQETDFSVVAPAGFYDEEVLLTVISKSSTGNLRLESVGGINRGIHWVFEQFVSRYELEDAEEKTPVGTVGIKMNNMAEEEVIYLSGDDGAREEFATFIQDESQVSIYDQPTVFYLVRDNFSDENPDAYSYLSISNVEAGKSYNIWPDVYFKNSLREYTINVPESEEFRVSGRASFTQNGEYNIRLGEIGNVNRLGKYYLPSDVEFAKYRFNVNRELGMIELGLEQYTESSQIDYEEIQARFRYLKADSREASVEITNPDFDFYQISWSNDHLDSPSTYIGWEFVAPASWGTLKLFDLSLVLPDLETSVVEAIVPVETFAIDFSDIHSYEELMPEFMIHMLGISLDGVQSYKYIYDYQSPLGNEGSRVLSSKRVSANPFLNPRRK